jgi:hypothetical protein
MRTNNSLPWRVIACLAILTGYFFSVSCTSVGKNQITTESHAVAIGEKGNNIRKTVKAADIKNALGKSTGEKIILNIYPVKRSNSPKKNDFDAMILFQDASDLDKNLGKDVSSKIFETQSASYVSFLKERKIPKTKIPFGYYIEINPAFMKNAGDLLICIDPEQALMKYCVQPEEKKSDPARTKDENCCSFSFRQPGDTIGKCPPCFIEKLWFQKPMQSVIERVYGKINNE